MACRVSSDIVRNSAEEALDKAKKGPSGLWEASLERS